MSFCPHCGNRLHRCAAIALCFIAALSVCAEGQDRSQPARVEPPAGSSPRPAAARGEIAAELDSAIFYVFQARNQDYWFGSNDLGVYRFDGKTLVHFTADDGLVSNRIRGIQEDRAGNVYFTTYEGISRFDGNAFSTLNAAAGFGEWKTGPDDLWFVGPPDAGVVFRYDGQTLHRLQFPATERGDEHFRKMPRPEFPNAIYSPYDIYCILKDRRGSLWFGSTCLGVCRFNGKDFHWFADRTLVEAPVRSILEDDQGNFWFTYTGHAPFDGFRPVDDFARLQEGSKGTIVSGMSVIEDEQGRLWTAALAAGVFRYDGDQRTRYPIRENDTPITVFAVYRDNQGTVWLGTHNGGAYRFNGTTFEKFRLGPPNATPPPTLPRNPGDACETPFASTGSGNRKET